MTFSPGLGVSSSNSAARRVLGVKTGVPSGTACTTCTRFLASPAARYFSSSDEIALRVESTFLVFSIPSAYLAWKKVRLVSAAE